MALRKVKLASLQARLRREKLSTRDYFIGVQRDRQSSEDRIKECKDAISSYEYSRLKGWQQSIAVCRRTMQKDLDVLESIEHEVQLLLSIEENKTTYMRLKLEGLI